MTRLLLGAGRDLFKAETELVPPHPGDGGGGVGAATGKNNHTWPDVAPNYASGNSAQIPKQQDPDTQRKCSAL